MTVEEAAFEVQIIPHTKNHWDIISARYEAGSLHIEFKDGTVGAVTISKFPALAGATEADFDHLEVGPCGLLLEHGDIEWDYAEAGLYALIKKQTAAN